MERGKEEKRKNHCDDNDNDHYGYETKINDDDYKSIDEQGDRMEMHKHCKEERSKA